MRKFVCTIIHHKDRKYRALMEMNGCEVKGLPEDVDYKTLVQAIRLKTGIEILKRKDMLFEKLSDFETIATIDSTQTRDDCRVSVKER